MKRYVPISAVLGTFLLAGLAVAQDLPHAPEPALIAPGVITIGEATTYRPSFTADGRVVIYTIEVREGEYALVQSERRDGAWGPPEILPFSGAYSDVEAFFSPDGRRLVFASRRPRPGGEPKRDYDLWVVERASGLWGTPQWLGQRVNSGDNELYPSLTRDGTLYFSRSGAEGSDLWFARAADEEFHAAELLPAPINTERREAGVFASPDGSCLIFDSNRSGLGGTDLFLTRRVPGGWTEPVALPAPVNSPAQETSAILSPDGGTLYFTSNRAIPGAPSLGSGLRYEDLLARMRLPQGGRTWHIYELPLTAPVCP